MIVYSGTLKQFSNDVLMGIIADRIEECFELQGFHHHNDAEYRAFNNSLMVMNNVLCNDSGIDQNVHVAIEYQIPLTSKRVDFLVTGYDEKDKENVIIVELKQWEECTATSRDDVVTTFVGGAVRAVAHPCYQAYSYAKAIESFNETVREKQIDLHPCAFCHNYKDEYVDQIKHPKYNQAIELAPLFLKKDQLALRDFVKKFIKKPDGGEILYTIENGRIKPSIALQDAIASLLKGNEVFTMIDEQQVAYATIKRLVEATIKSDKKHTVIIQGGPGTGKSVIAVNLLSHLISRGYNVEYVTKNAAPRNVFVTELVRQDYKKRYVDNLFKGSGSFVDCKPNLFDCLLVDEAHRLNEKSGLFQNKGENQIKEIIAASKISVFFIDEDQVVTTKDIGSVAEIVKWAKKLGSEVHLGEDLILASQFRCGGSDGYLAFLDNLLEIKETANVDLFDIDYDVRVFDDPNAMREELRELNKKNNKARMIAGYCYNWISRSNPAAFDIELKNGFRAQWNFASTSTWAIDEDSFDQVGCIHTSQGLEFDYCGVIIGKDLTYRDGKIVPVPSARAKTDQSLRGCKSKELADRIIKNTYKTLLSRGQKGCFIYCEDDSLREYLQKMLTFKEHYSA